jgi:hypothetical protein
MKIKYRPNLEVLDAWLFQLGEPLPDWLQEAFDHSYLGWNENKTRIYNYTAPQQVPSVGEGVWLVRSLVPIIDENFKVSKEVVIRIYQPETFEKLFEKVDEVQV